MMPELSLNIMDLAENCIRAEATLVEIALDENIKTDILSVKIIDNGKGMSDEFVKQITNPFITTRATRKVGLGIPFVKQIADMCEGELKIDSTEGVGTTISFSMKLSHIDRPPVGNIANTIHSLIVLNPEIDFSFSYTVDEEEFKIETKAWKEILGEIPINELSISTALKKEITEGLKKIGR
jgi:hypothetical protein